MLTLRLWIQCSPPRTAQAEAALGRQLEAGGRRHFALVVEGEFHQVPLPHATLAEVIP